MSRNSLLPKDFFDEKFLMTAGGTTAGVWMTCGVLNSLTIGWLADYYWRWIAFVFSMLLSFAFRPNKGSTTIRSVIIIFLNGIVVYAGASGFNAINNGVDLWGNKTAKEPKKGKELSIIPFKEVDWWPNKRMERQVQQLQLENSRLKQENYKFRDSLRILPTGKAVKLMGEILNSETGEPIKGVLISTGNIKVSSSEDGGFAIWYEKLTDFDELSFEKKGFAKYSVKINSIRASKTFVNDTTYYFSKRPFSFLRVELNPRD